MRKIPHQKLAPKGKAGLSLLFGGQRKVPAVVCGRACLQRSGAVELTHAPILKVFARIDRGPGRIKSSGIPYLPRLILAYIWVLLGASLRCLQICD